MRCPFCAANRDRVVDSRESRDGDTIRRRRECLDCGRRFTSYEQIEELRRMVVKRDGTREEFSRGKLLAGLSRACEKRPVRLRELDQVAYVRFASVYRRFEDIDAFLDVLEGLVTPAAPAPKAAPAKTERP